MKESIKIVDFGPINEIIIDDIKPLVVLIGESGSGKSTFMKVLAIFRHIHKLKNIRSFLKLSGISKSPFRIRMESYWNNSGFLEYITDKTEVLYTNTSSNGNKYILHFKNRKLSGTAPGDVILSEDLCLNKISYISETRNSIAWWVKRGKTDFNSTLDFYFNEVLEDFVDASEKITNLSMDFLKVNLLVKKLNTGRYFHIQSSQKGKQYDVKLENSSSGMINVAPLLLIAQYFSGEYRFEEGFNKTMFKYLLAGDKLTDFKAITDLRDMGKYVFLLIEEPELSLYPDAQCDLMSELIATCFNNPLNKTGVMLSTHSPYIINYLNLLIKAGEKNKKIRNASLLFRDLAVYNVTDGKFEDLMIQNEKLVNTNLLSDTINHIYEQFNDL